LALAARAGIGSDLPVDWASKLTVKEEHQNFEEFESDVESLCDWLKSLSIKFERGRYGLRNNTF
jgi:hypothetical protein